jgi:hypothetical protein
VSTSDRTEQENIERIASAIEDMLKMGILKLVNIQATEKAVFSVKFSSIVSNLIEENKASNAQPEAITTLMYHSLLIFMNEILGVPKELVMAFGKDIEKYKDEMESAAIIFQYATILQKLFFEGKKRSSSVA